MTSYEKAELDNTLRKFRSIQKGGAIGNGDKYYRKIDSYVFDINDLSSDNHDKKTIAKLYVENEIIKIVNNIRDYRYIYSNIIDEINHFTNISHLTYRDDNANVLYVTNDSMNDYDDDKKYDDVLYKNEKIMYTIIYFYYRDGHGLYNENPKYIDTDPISIIYVTYNIALWYLHRHNGLKYDDDKNLCFDCIIWALIDIIGFSFSVHGETLEQSYIKALKYFETYYDENAGVSSPYIADIIDTNSSNPNLLIEIFKSQNYISYENVANSNDEDINLGFLIANDGELFYFIITCINELDYYIYLSIKEFMLNVYYEAYESQDMSENQQNMIKKYSDVFKIDPYRKNKGNIFNTNRNDSYVFLMSKSQEKAQRLLYYAAFQEWNNFDETESLETESSYQQESVLKKQRISSTKGSETDVSEKGIPVTSDDIEQLSQSLKPEIETTNIAGEALKVLLNDIFLNNDIILNKRKEINNDVNIRINVAKNKSHFVKDDLVKDDLVMQMFFNNLTPDADVF